MPTVCRPSRLENYRQAISVAALPIDDWLVAGRKIEKSRKLLDDEKGRLIQLDFREQLSRRWKRGATFALCFTSLYFVQRRKQCCRTALRTWFPRVQQRNVAKLRATACRSLQVVSLLRSRASVSHLPHFSATRCSLITLLAASHPFSHPAIKPDIVPYFSARHSTQVHDHWRHKLPLANIFTSTYSLARTTAKRQSRSNQSGSVCANFWR